MYLGLRPPWGGHGAAAADAAQVAVAPGDAGSAKPKSKRHPTHRRPSPGGGAAPAGPATGGGDSDDQAWANQGDSVQETGPAPVVLSAADRVLEWRGDDVSPPPRKIDMTSEARPLDDAEIKSTIASQSGSAQSCVVQAATNAPLQATITVKMVVDAKGHVARSKLQAPHYLFAHGLLECIKPALARMKFPATGMPTLVTMPINLT
ncbi:MAG TPA: hypothetical protein VGF94_24295 [Kofleriaceae bacterium]